MASNACLNSPGMTESQRSMGFNINDILSTGNNRFGILGDVADTEDTANMEVNDNSPNDGQSVFSVNSYENDGDVDDDDDDDDVEAWTTYRGKHKRQRISTGGKSNDLVSHGLAPEDLNIDSMTADEKLSLILKTMSINQAKIVNLEKKLDTALASGKQVRQLEKSLQSHNDRITLLEYRSIDQEARQRRNNLLFRGHPESRYEDTANLIRQFLHKDLGVTGDIPIDRAHRLGPFIRGRQRLIIVAFSRYRDTEIIMSNAYNLRGSQFGISRDYPPEITEARKILWPEYRQLQSKYPKSKITVAYPAKIIKDSTVVRDMFPNWNAIMKGRRIVSTCTQVAADKRKQSSRQTGSTRDARDTQPRNAPVRGSRPNAAIVSGADSCARVTPTETPTETPAETPAIVETPTETPVETPVETSVETTHTPKTSGKAGSRGTGGTSTYRSDKFRPRSESRNRHPSGARSDGNNRIPSHENNVNKGE